MVTINELQAAVVAFRDARNWRRFHHSRNLAMAISVEAGELLDLFKFGVEWYDPRLDEIAAEVADVVIYCMCMADALGFDLEQAIVDKMIVNGEKYPEVSIES